MARERLEVAGVFRHFGQAFRDQHGVSLSAASGFFLPVRVLSRMFRGLFLHHMEKAFAAGALNFFSAHRHLHEPAAFRRCLASVRDTDWVVYAKRPFAGPAQVLDYVGRYTHRVAISNNRLVSMEADKVRFRWKDYRDGNRQKTMSLQAGEFIRRFLIHVLPDGFHRIRYYGFLGNCHRARKLDLCRELLAMAPAGPAADPRLADYRDRYEALTGRSLRQCPLCHTGHGGDRLHREAQGLRLPARPGHVMTSDRRPGRTKSNRPPYRSGDIVAARVSGAPEPGPELRSSLLGASDGAFGAASRSRPPPRIARWCSGRGFGGIQRP